MIKYVRTLDDNAIAVALGVITLLVLLVTAPQIGLTWDEPAYIAASESYFDWFREVFSNPREAFSQETIDFYWAVNHEHPPLDKIWSGLVWGAARLIFDDLLAHRLGNILLAAVLVPLVYLLVAQNFGRLAGLASAMVLLSLPRFFFHAHLAALDVPAAVVVFIVVFVFWRTKDLNGWKPTVILGVIWGLAVATKINAVFVMPVLILWVLIFQRETRLFGRLAAASAIAFVIFVAAWPWLYPQPIVRLIEYIRWITVDHWQIGQYYLGRFHMPPPWHFPFVIGFAVTPVFVLLFYLTGLTRSLRRFEQRPLGALLALNSVVPLLALSIGQSMVYDNERLFMPAFVFIAALAGIGVDWAAKAVEGWSAEKEKPRLVFPATVLLLGLAVLPQLISAAPLYPHWLSYYSGTVGGLRGASELGLETTYWCETYTEALSYLNEHAQPGDIVWVDPWSHDVMVYYQQLGQVRNDLKIAVPQMTSSILGSDANLVQADYKQADLIVLQYRQTSTAEGGASWPILVWLMGREPELRVDFQGVPLFEIYHNP
jgi:4-amino-4-deoxy-L-arabinose transferase-like glycosyltransferase